MHRVIVCILLLLFCARVVAEPPPPLTIAVTDPMALDNACACIQGYAQRDYNALAKHLQKQLGRPVQVQFSATLPAIVQKIGRNPDIIIGIKSLTEHEASALKIGVTHVAMLTDMQGSTEFCGLFVARTKDPMQTLADLKGKSIVFGPADRDEKYTAAFAAMKAVGIDPPAQPAIADNCNIAGGKVAKSEFDAGVISSYAMPLLVGCEAVAAGELKVIGKTGTMPFVAAFVTDRVPADDRGAVKQAILSVANDKDLCTKLESKSGFVPSK